MAEQKSNWLWWTLGGVALLGVGVGTYLYFRNRTKGEQLKNDGKVYIPPVVPPPSSTSTSIPRTAKVVRSAAICAGAIAPLIIA